MRPSVRAAAALVLAVGALISPNTVSASAIDEQRHTADPTIGPLTAQPPIVEPRRRWQQPVPACLESLHLPRFTGSQFNELFTRTLLPNLSPVSDAPLIVDAGEMDEQIRDLAEGRGYMRRPLPDDHASLRELRNGVSLQRPAAAAWLALQQDAAEHGLRLRLVSAYRGHRYQRVVFLRPLTAPYRLDDLAARMRWSAPPGYSKHHTGYAIDISQAGFSSFGGSPAYRWLAADNFANAKRHGWIPSYPPDGGRQGPEPEPWEFTYVGLEAILCVRWPAALAGPSPRARMPQVGSDPVLPPAPCWLQTPLQKRSKAPTWCPEAPHG